MMHAGLVGVLTSILKDVGILDIAVVTEARGLREADAFRAGDVVVQDFFAEGRHLVVDVVVTTVYRNTILQGVASIPRYAAKQAQDMKLYVDKTSTQRIAAIHGGPHVLVPFAIEDRGRLGAHALALLRSLAIVALDKGRRPPFAHRACVPSSSSAVSLWVQR